MTSCPCGTTRTSSTRSSQSIVRWRRRPRGVDPRGDPGGVARKVCTRLVQAKMVQVLVFYKGHVPCSKVLKVGSRYLYDSLDVHVRDSLLKGSPKLGWLVQHRRWLSFVIMIYDGVAALEPAGPSTSAPAECRANFQKFWGCRIQSLDHTKNPWTQSSYLFFVRVMSHDCKSGAAHFVAPNRKERRSHPSAAPKNPVAARQVDLAIQAYDSPHTKAFLLLQAESLGENSMGGTGRVGGWRILLG